MLVSLIKYEFKATYKTFFLLYILVLTFSVINRFLIDFNTGIDYLSLQTAISPVKITMIIFTILYGFIMAATAVLTIFITVQRFYKNILGDTGYLMNTLPIRPWMNIFSKLFVSTFWIMLGMFVCIVSVFVLLTQGMSFSYIFKSFFEFISDIFDENAFIPLMKFFICVVIGQAANVMLVYCSMALGHLFNKHRKLMSFLFFLLIFIITSHITSFVTFNTNTLMATQHFGSFINKFSYFANFGLFLNMVFISITFAVTNYILENKLNLE